MFFIELFTATQIWDLTVGSISGYTVIVLYNQDREANILADLATELLSKLQDFSQFERIPLAFQLWDEKILPKTPANYHFLLKLRQLNEFRKSAFR